MTMNTKMTMMKITPLTKTELSGLKMMMATGGTGKKAKKSGNLTKKTKIDHAGIGCCSHHGGARNQASWESGRSIIGRPKSPPLTVSPPSGFVAHGLGK